MLSSSSERVPRREPEPVFRTRPGVGGRPSSTWAGSQVVPARIRAPGSRRPPQRPARTDTRVFAPFEHDLAVDDHRFNPLILLERLEVRGPIADGFGVEEGDIGKLAGPEQAAVGDAELG